MLNNISAAAAKSFCLKHCKIFSGEEDQKKKNSAAFSLLPFSSIQPLEAKLLVSVFVSSIETDGYR